MMDADRDNRADVEGGWGRIVGGLLLALLGAGAVMLGVLGASCLYVGRFGLGAIEGVLAIVGGAAFALCYGPYLDRLERRAPMQDDDADKAGKMPAPQGGRAPVLDDNAAQAGRTPAPQDDDRPAEPLPSNVVIALATAAYGVIVLAGGLIWTQHRAAVLNVISGAALLACAGAVWRLGRSTRGKAGPDGEK